MVGETDLKKILRNMEPVVVQGEYVFCSIEENQLDYLEQPLLVFRENEGPTVVVTKSVAIQHGFSFDSIWGLISLSIHSNLQSMGLLAAITTQLAKAGISVNAVSAFYHDHLFVPHERITDALSILINLSKSQL